MLSDCFAKPHIRLNNEALTGDSPNVIPIHAATMHTVTVFTEQHFTYSVDSMKGAWTCS